MYAHMLWHMPMWRPEDNLVELILNSGHQPYATSTSTLWAILMLWDQFSYIQKISLEISFMKYFLALRLLFPQSIFIKLFQRYLC